MVWLTGPGCVSLVIMEHSIGSLFLSPTLLLYYRAFGTGRALLESGWIRAALILLYSLFLCVFVVVQYI